MTPRERILNTLNRTPVDRPPVDIWYVGEVLQALYQHTNTDNEQALWRALGLDKWAWVNPTYTGPLVPKAPEATWVNHWGQQFKTIQSGPAAYLEQLAPPLAGYTRETLADYPYWPDPATFDYAAMGAQTKQLAQEFATLGPWISLFEIYCGLRGLEQAMMDLVLEPEFVTAALDRIDAIQTAMLENIFAHTGDALDAVFISDDMGSQQGLLISPATWEEFFQPRFKRWCDLTHAHGAKVFHHTDGAVRPLIPRYIELGVDVLNPIQHICPGMDMAALKRDFGAKLIFHGGVDTQDVLPFRDPAAVCAETRACLEALGPGFICCSCHNIQAGTPVDNILAMIDTVHKF